MSISSVARRAVLGIAALGLVGCGDSGELQEGMPKNIDMSKNYSPPVATPTITPKDMLKAKARPPGAEAPPLQPATTPANK